MRKHESASSIGTFLSCNYGYCLNYVDKVKSKVGDAVTSGAAIHRALDKGSKAARSQPFIKARDEFLEQEGIEIVKSEEKFILEGKMSLQGYIDAIGAYIRSGEEVNIEYKITSSPGFYESQLSYQARVYSFTGRKMIYLLFEVDKKDRYEFKKLHVKKVAVSPLAKIESKQWLDTIHDQLKVCYKSGVFPPSFNGCYRCFYKANCKNYWGW